MLRRGFSVVRQVYNFQILRLARKMKKGQMVGTRLPSELVRELELIEDAEQSDRSTPVRRLLTKAIQQWKLEHYVRLYGDKKLTLARAARDAGDAPSLRCGYGFARNIKGKQPVA